MTLINCTETCLRINWTHLIEIFSSVILPILAIFITHLVDIRMFKNNKLYEYKLKSYKVLLLKINEMVDEILTLYPHGLVIIEDSKEKNNRQALFQSAHIAINSAYREFVCNNIFLKDKNLSNKIDVILNMCNKQLSDYRYVNASDSDYPRDEKIKLYAECIAKNEEIQKLNIEIMNDIKKQIEVFK
ncbi:MAG: hypothetical protein IJ312_05940 [Treponema sp.]|nr:hypothetical protein [Treponema sp.]